MGTRGYKVYRHRGWYHVRYNHWDSYPSGLGVDIAGGIPRDPQKYQGWLKHWKQSLDRELEEMRGDDRDADCYGDFDYTITREQPSNDLFIEWIYEIDLDNEIFHVDSQPLFRLDNMPTTKVFVNSIGFDSYGHRAYRISTPKKHRYNWRAAPPQIPQTAVDRYGSCSVEDSSVSIHELLGVPASLAASETTCVHLFQVMIGLLMKEPQVGISIRRLEQASTRDEIPSDLLTLGRAIVSRSIGPMFYTDAMAFAERTPLEETQGFTWICPRVCLRVTTHLDDQRNLQAVVADIVDAAMRRPNVQGVIYGIGFSFFHCVIVRIDTDDQGSFKHTSALQFIPSWYATSQSTVGITALVRLGHLFNALDLLCIPPTPEVHAHHLLRSVPQEIWMLIASHLFSLSDFITLGGMSPQARAAVNMHLKFPHLEENQISRIKTTMQINETNHENIELDNEDEDEDEDDGEGGQESLWSAEFEVVRDGQPGLTMQIPCHPTIKKSAEVDKGNITFHLGWCLEYAVLVPC